MELKLINTSSENFLCDRYEVLDCNSFQDLGNAIKDLEREFPDYRFLATLDDLGQACYTSMHTKMFHDLDSVEGASISNLPQECFEDGEHKGFFEHKEEFGIRKQNIGKKLSSASFEDVCNKGIGLYCECEKDFDEANTNHDSILDRRIYILKVPVDYCYETICAFPNGYFDCDLSPFENVVFARLLEEKYGYQLVGLGASYLAFRKSKELDDIKVQELIEQLNIVYRDEFDINLRNSLSRYIKENDYLMLSYTE